MPVAGTADWRRTQDQQVTAIQAGYALFLANCARCHGDHGQGGIGPPLNDQAKLYNAVTATGAPGPATSTRTTSGTC